jgi:hypothetical protein
MPSIPEIDNAPASTKNSFMQYIESNFSDKISSFQNSFGAQLAPKVDPTQYLKMLGL